jgi:acetoacetate decarboxylase
MEMSTTSITSLTTARETGQGRDPVTPDGKAFRVPDEVTSIFGPPDYHFKGCTTYAVTFQTDGDLVSAMLPAPLVAAAPDQMTLMVNTMVGTAADATVIGPYHEMTLLIPATYEHHQGQYAVQLYLGSMAESTNVLPILLGLNMYGIPKREGVFKRIDEAGRTTVEIERYGATIVAANFTIGDDLPIPDGQSVYPLFNLKYFPAVEGHGAALLQLTKVAMVFEPATELRAVDAHITDDRIVLDTGTPIPVKKILDAFYMKWDFTLPAGEVLWDYLRS